jgi:hypothetical protein
MVGTDSAAASECNPAGNGVLNSVADATADETIRRVRPDGILIATHDRGVAQGRYHMP